MRASTTTVYLGHVAPVGLVEKMRTQNWSLQSYGRVLRREAGGGPASTGTTPGQMMIWEPDQPR